MSEELFGTNTKAEDTRRLFEFSRLNNEIFERFKLFCVGEYEWKEEWELESLLAAIFTKFDKDHNWEHAKALDAFYEDQTTENMHRYLAACDGAVKHAYKTKMLKKVGLTFEDLKIWDALSPEKPKVFRLSLSDLEKL